MTDGNSEEDTGIWISLHLDGVEEIKFDHWSLYNFKASAESIPKIADKVDLRTIISEHFKYLKSVAGDTLCKMTIFTIYAVSDLLVRAEEYILIERYQT